FEQCAGAATVLHGRPRFETMHADGVEGEFEQELGSFFEYARPPERRADGEAPFGRPEARFRLTHLEDADRRVEACDRHREARIRPELPLTQRPGDESLEAL